jgi:N-acetylglucosaminyldiphosphoundecaprenol N-acetyl-beta-D-mannosaminyltransferase
MSVIDRPAVRTLFLDRDGTINRKPPEGTYVTRPEDFVLLPDVGPAIRRLNRAGVKVIVVTNQRGVARGLMSESTLADVHHAMHERLAEHGAHVDGVYSCTHDVGECDCRKPGPGLLLRAMRDDPDIAGAPFFVVGDSVSDIEAGVAAGGAGVLLAPAGDPAHDSGGGHVASTLEAAVEWVLGKLAAARVSIMGLGFDSLDEHQVVERVVRSITSGRGGWMVNPNTDVLRQTVKHAELRELVSTADLVVADGMPVVWASCLQRTPIPERVAGSTLIRTLARAAAEHEIPVFLLGGAEGVAERAAARLEAEIPGLVTGSHAPPFGFESDLDAKADIDMALTAFGPAIYFCGFGFPKQEWLMADLVRRYRTSWFIGSGASLAFVAGETKRAPEWMQRAGLEWLHRLGQEPRRLFRRYVIEDAPFAVQMMANSLAGPATSGRSR